MNATALSMKQLLLTLPLSGIFRQTGSESNHSGDRVRYLKQLPKVNLMIDEKNGYLSISDYSGPFSFKFTLVKWKCEDGSILAGITYHFDGCDDDEDGYSFFRQQQSSWKDVTKNAIQPLYTPMIHLSNGMNLPAALYLTLPQKGTSIIGKYAGLQEYEFLDTLRFLYPNWKPKTNDDRSEMDVFRSEYDSLLEHNYSSTPISFKWNKQAAKFEKQ